MRPHAITQRYEDMSRADLLREIYSLQGRIGAGAEEDPKTVTQELRAYQEELRVQHSQLIESQQALEESRDRYANLFDFAPVGYLTIDASGLVTEINLAAATMLGAERDRLVSYPLLAHVFETDRHLLLDHLSRCRTQSHAVQTRMRLQGRAGLVSAVNLISRRADAGEDELWHTAIIDLTEQERAERERRRAEEDRLLAMRREQSLLAASEAKDRFLAILSHELRTPLTPISFILDVLEARGALPHDVREAIELAGFQCHLIKPVDVDELVRAVERIKSVGRGKARSGFESTDGGDDRPDYPVGGALRTTRTR